MAGKSTSYIPTSSNGDFGLLSYGYISLNLLMLFDRAFQMKCKYIGMHLMVSLLFNETTGINKISRFL